MNLLVTELHFKYQWRPYQAKVLKNFSKHIQDNHFHIVAPPGSGKTILGIEILKRINKKTVILAPTLTIRNQWEDRLQSFFTKNTRFTSVSYDIKKPSFLTFSTYQSLHSFFKTFENKLDYFHFFKKQGIEVILLDEAHHLKNEWWKCLYELKEKNQQTIVALTATPPYDSENSEVQKYFDLCGEIDDEIVVPDLVKEENLCPHQDLIFLSKPEDQEINFITDFRLKIADFVSSIVKDETFITFIKEHRFYSKTKENLEEIYKNSEFFSAILIFLQEAKEEISFDKLFILGFDSKSEVIFPQLTHKWIEILFQHILVYDREYLLEHETYISSLEKQLRQLSVFNRNKVNLIGNDLLYKSLSNSTSKLKSIITIVSQEENNLKENLRCVILTDYIRKEYLNFSENEYAEMQKIGVVPIFHFLKNKISKKESLAVLTGSLVIVHKSIIFKLQEIDTLDNYTMNPLKTDSDFVTLTSKSTSKNIVGIITQLFELGHIQVLVGTKSLLGEGWDAPSINSLILASVVGSFVTSNQMRGRAIRTHKNTPNKVGLIWHLACVDTTDETGGRDLEILSRRFNSFLGISNHNTTVIKNGIDRLNLPEKIFENDIETLNRRTLEESKNRTNISLQWEKAVFNGKKIGEELLFLNSKKSVARQKKMYYKDIVKYSIFELLVGVIFFMIQFLINNFGLLLQKGTFYFIYFFAGLLFLNFGFKIYKSLQLYFNYGLIHKKIYKIAFTIIDSLHELKILKTPDSEISVITDLQSNGNVTCSIEGCDRYESKVFINALEEVLQVIENPKYLIITTNRFQRKPKARNSFSVPEIFEGNKKKALIFQKYWNKHVGNSTLFFTRHIEGRRLLLKARLYHIHNVHKKVTKKNVIWK